ncbi:cell division-specific peptidoglycan biosynthesis regulator FtsW [Alteromonadaceae bacterium Bs31]|nr:cell division-specific peptidoglycan biosynthesis regulator FtsW [Alteromonadaceae bacterium Bs31]
MSKTLSLQDCMPPMNMDSGLLLSVMALISIGVVMVATSTFDFADAKYDDSLYFLKKHSIYLTLGVFCGLVASCVPTTVWQRYSPVLLIFAVVCLILVLVPGVGKVVNGSRRWLNVGPLTMQASELAKFCLLIYFASYLARKNNEIQREWAGFFKMLAIIALIVALLLLEPDFGSSVVICLTLGSMMFIAGVPILRFLLLAVTGAGLLSSMAVLSPYRWERLVSFMDPWSQQFGGGYQLVQSLIAFGRGEWFGLGLGNSLQKLFFLPEAHTDFVFAIYAEEFGLLGAIVLIALYGFFIWKILILAKLAYGRNKLFSSFLVSGIAVMMAVQSFINMGVASGLLPTKGLTLPFISYGGSSLLVSCVLVALVFRVAWEERYGC